MNPEVASLVELQQVDLSLADLATKRDAVPGRIAAVEAQLRDFLENYEDRKKRLATNQKERRDLEGDIQAVRDKIGRHKDQLYELKNNEQYKAMLHEIAGEEEKIGKIEDRILEKMVEAEQLDQYVKEAGARLEGEKARVAAEVKRLEAERQTIEDDRTQQEERRRALVAGLNPTDVALYEKVRKARGLAVVEVRDGSCGGCHVRLRPQAYNEVRQEKSLSVCETCGRILFYVEPEGATAEAEAPGAFHGGTRVQMS